MGIFRKKEKNTKTQVAEHERIRNSNNERISDLESRLGMTLDAVNGIHQTERRSAIIGTVFTTILALATIILGSLGYSEFSSYSDKAQRTVAEISGTLKPLTSELFVNDPRLPQTKYATANSKITIEETNTPGSNVAYYVVISTQVWGRSYGPPGKLIGIEFNHSGSMVDILTKDASGKTNLGMKRSVETTKFEPLGDHNTMSIAENGHYNLYTSLSSQLIEKCEDAKRMVTELMAGTITLSIAPVFERIEDAPNLQHFPLKPIQVSKIGCPL
ncbi:hypothetical protein [Shimia haliotis]|uniref:Uncharacterized protein n=1 Tax=Shimia haliotis TaxID=1280847 RepID=A0A1I4G0R2_9RHOB|nr:hypothetical protein [Shimia haliotis]SFL23110.1 hypothetical protein SAMN04488036_10767 [Shimia haliotis]